MAHSIFSASASSRWLNCPGSLALTKGIPSKGSAAAFLGTAGHALADQCLKDGTNPEDYSEVSFYSDGKDHTVSLDQDFTNGLQKYVDFVRGFTGIHLPEMRVCYGDWLGIDNKYAFGTSDSIVYDAEFKALHIADLKTGRIFVESKNNPQMLLYAAGAITTLEWLGHEVDSVCMTIVQPFVHSAPQTWTLSRAKFNRQVGRMKPKAREAAMIYMAADKLKSSKKLQGEFLNPGEAQCMWCQAKTFCPALTRVVERDIPPASDEEFTVMAKKLTADELGARLDRLPLVKMYIKAIEEEAMSRLSQGQPVTGRKLVLGRQGARAWEGKPDEVIQVLTDAGLTDDLFMNPPSLRTPTQVETAVKRDKDQKALIDTLVIRAPGKPTMAEMSDPREPWQGTISDDEFEVIG